jgi:RND family efflux transporter MFP subunit
MLRAKVSEIVEAVHARVGDPVQKGQVLVEFRRTDLEADILAAETAHEEACNNYERYQSLWEQGVVSAERRDVARTRRDNAAAQLEAARSRLKFAEVLSPIDGIVERRWVEPGEYKGEGDELMSVIDLSVVEVSALVPEEDMAHLTVGAAGQFQPETASRWMEGRLTRISPSTADPNRFFGVFMKVPNEPLGGGWLLRPGMYVEVRFARGAPERHVGVPDSAFRLEGSEPVIFLVETALQRVPVDEPAEDEEQGGFVSRLRRGWGRLRELRGAAGSGGGDQGAEAGSYEEKEAPTARRLVVREGLRTEDLVQLVGDPVSTEDLVIVNPRDAIEDGTMVRVVAGEGGQ